MADIIQLLPDSVANQIAAGEVIQRPASVVKELMENAVDSGAQKVQVVLRDAGKTLVQVIDDGCGMSGTDARLAFERHATSKIRDVNDLFAIRTMGFRGEALASIAAIAKVNLKSKRKEDELGVEIDISGSRIEKQEPAQCGSGSNFMVKSLFYNVPARRKFLKKDTTELKHVVNEFQRVVLANPSVEFKLVHNDNEIYSLPVSKPKQRIVNVFGKNINQNLIPLESDTELIKISGYIGKPETARKTMGEQYFFINNRYMRHPYFHKAITNAYGTLIANDEIPSYFLFFETDPSSIDINIHPTKTEIKFQDERAIWQILSVSIKQALGKSNMMPAIDFDTAGKIDIPVAGSNTTPPSIPEVRVDHGYNPFNDSGSSGGGHGISRKERNDLSNWEMLYHGFEKPSVMNRSSETSMDTLSGEQGGRKGLSQFKLSYIMTQVKSGLMLIDQQRAHERVLYEQFIRSMSHEQSVGQQSLFPKTIQLDAHDYQIVIELADDLLKMGFDIRDFGNRSVVIHAIPASSKNEDPEKMLQLLVEEYKNTENDLKESAKKRLARSLASAACVKRGVFMSEESLQELFDRLFACEEPSYSPGGKTIVQIISLDEINKRFTN